MGFLSKLFHRKTENELLIEEMEACGFKAVVPKYRRFRRISHVSDKWTFYINIETLSLTADPNLGWFVCVFDDSCLLHRKADDTVTFWFYQEVGSLREAFEVAATFVPEIPFAGKFRF